MPSEPLLVPLGALLFYALDALLLLYGNELALEARGRAGWRSGTGADTLLGGRRPWWPQLLAPWRPVWRLSWSDTGEGGALPPGALAQLARTRAALRPVGACVALLQWLMIPGLAALFVAGRMGPELLALLGTLYALVVVAAFAVWWRRGELGLGHGACAALAAEGLLCPPLAINMVRKVSLRQRPGCDPLALLAAAGTRAELSAMRGQLARRVRQALSAEAEGSERHVRLARQLEQLEESR